MPFIFTNLLQSLFLRLLLSAKAEKDVEKATRIVASILALDQTRSSQFLITRPKNGCLSKKKIFTLENWENHEIFLSFWVVLKKTCVEIIVFSRFEVMKFLKFVRNMKIHIANLEEERMSRAARNVIRIAASKRLPKNTFTSFVSALLKVYCICLKTFSRDVKRI